MNSERDAGAYLAGRALNLGNTLFKCLALNARFRFATGSTVFIKTSERGYRAEVNGRPEGRTFKTGMRAACFMEPEESC